MRRNPLWLFWRFFCRWRLSPEYKQSAWLVSQRWGGTQAGSLVTRVRVGVECHISHYWEASVFHPLFILKAFLGPSPGVAGGGKRMDSVFLWCMAARGPGSFHPQSQESRFPQEQMASVASWAAESLYLLCCSILKSGLGSRKGGAWRVGGRGGGGVAKVAMLTTSQHK